VKAYGSTMQIRFSRQDKRRNRVEALAEKHARVRRQPGDA